MSNMVIMSIEDLKKFGVDLIKEYEKKHTKPPKEKEWLGKDETMEFLNVTSSTLDNLRHKRLIEFNTCTRPFLYKRESLVRYKESKAISASRG